MEPQRCPVSNFSVSPARLVPNAVSGSGVRAKLERRQSEGRAKALRTFNKVRCDSNTMQRYNHRIAVYEFPRKNI